MNNFTITTISLFLLTLGSLSAQTDQYFYLHNNWQGPDRVLTATDDHTVIMDDRTGMDNQQWSEVRDEVNKRWYLKNKALGDAYLLQFGDGESEENILVMGVSTQEDNQFWVLANEYDNGSKKITVASIGTEYVLDCDPDQNGPMVFMAPSSNASGQFWTIEPVVAMQGDAPMETTVVEPVFEETWHPENDRKKVPVKVTQEEVKQLNEFAKKIYFNSGRSTFRPKVTDELDKIVQFMKAHPNAEFEIGGHTDTAGAASNNLKLTDSRAKAVRDYLVDNGVTNRLRSVGYGEDYPIGDNTTRAGRAMNRRVEIKLVD